MKKIIYKTIVISAIILMPLFSVWAESVWTYTAPNTKNGVASDSKNDFTSEKDCNTDRTAYMNDPEYKNNPKIYLTPTPCIEEPAEATSSTIKIRGLDVTDTEILVSTITQFVDTPGTEKKREIIALLFDSKETPTLLSEATITNREVATGVGTTTFKALQPETTYKVRVYLKETTVRSFRPNIDKLIYNPESYVFVTTNKAGQTTSTSASTTDMVNISGQKVIENKSIYKFLVPIAGKTHMNNEGCATEDTTCIGNNIGDYLNIIFKIGIGLCAALAVVMLIIYGVMYMGDESVFGKTEAKSKMFSAIFGLLISLGAWALLNTINPYLTGKGGLAIDNVSIEVTRNRAIDINFIKNLDSFDTSGITITPADYSSDLFLGYMAHQQGVAGISAILWSANKGLAQVSKDNPFTKGDIEGNMKSNFNASSAQKTIGTSEITPSTFIKYWAIKILAAKRATNPPILPAIDTELLKVASETGVDIETLRTICRIESAGGCTTQESITTINGGGYAGLFQIGNDVWNKYKNKTKDKNILSAYDNALVGALYYKDNLASIKKNLPTINK